MPGSGATARGAPKLRACRPPRTSQNSTPHSIRLRHLAQAWRSALAPQARRAAEKPRRPARPTRPMAAQNHPFGQLIVGRARMDLAHRSEPAVHLTRLCDSLQQCLEAGDLAGLLAHVELGQDQAACAPGRRAGGLCGCGPWPRRTGSSRPLTVRPRPGPAQRRRCVPAAGGPSPPAAATVPDQTARRAVPAPVGGASAIHSPAAGNLRFPTPRASASAAISMASPADQISSP